METLRLNLANCRSRLFLKDRKSWIFIYLVQIKFKIRVFSLSQEKETQYFPLFQRIDPENYLVSCDVHEPVSLWDILINGGLFSAINNARPSGGGVTTTTSRGLRVGISTAAASISRPPAAGDLLLGNEWMCIEVVDEGQIVFVNLGWYGVKKRGSFVFL